MSQDFFQTIFNRLFGKEDGASANQPFVTERLVRNGSFQERYDQWIESAEFTLVMTNLRNAYHQAMKAGGKSQEMGLFIYESPQARGFYFNDQLKFSPQTFAFLLDYFRDVVIAEGYQVYTSDRKIDEAPAGVECVERHYLKPAINRHAEAPLDQGYGNILIEYKTLNDRPVYLKLMANIYSDRNYLEARPFEELVKKLFDEKTSGIN